MNRVFYTIDNGKAYLVTGGTLWIPMQIMILLINEKKLRNVLLLSILYVVALVIIHYESSKNHEFFICAEEALLVSCYKKGELTAVPWTDIPYCYLIVNRIMAQRHSYYVFSKNKYSETELRKLLFKAKGKTGIIDGNVILYFSISLSQRESLVVIKEKYNNNFFNYARFGEDAGW